MMALEEAVGICGREEEKEERMRTLSIRGPLCHANEAQGQVADLKVTTLKCMSQGL